MVVKSRYFKDGVKIDPNKQVIKKPTTKKEGLAQPKPNKIKEAVKNGIERKRFWSGLAGS